ncbi:outer membrane beta-barrel protein [Planctomycetota bacterium]
MKRLMWLMGIVVLLATHPILAAVQEGDTEIHLGGSYQKYNGGSVDGVKGPDVTNFHFLGGYNYFMTDNISLGVLLGYDSYEYKAETAGSSYKDQFLGLGASVKYHFMIEELLVPYLGLELMYHKGLNVGNRDVLALDARDGTSVGIGGGIRYELNPQNDFFIEYIYQKLFGDFTSTNVGLKGLNLDDAHFIRFGIIHQFN